MNKKITTHLIENYDATGRTIQCCCLEWEGHEDDFAYHQDTSPPTTLKPTPLPFPLPEFNFTYSQMKKVLSETPHFFDYVRDTKASPITGKKRKR